MPSTGKKYFPLVIIIFLTLMVTMLGYAQEFPQRPATADGKNEEIPTVMYDVQSPRGERIRIKSFVVNGAQKVKEFFLNIDHQLDGFHFVHSAVPQEVLTQSLPRSAWQRLNENSIGFYLGQPNVESSEVTSTYTLKKQKAIEGFITTIVETSTYALVYWHFSAIPVTTQKVMAFNNFTLGLFNNIVPDFMDKHLFRVLQNKFRKTPELRAAVRAIEDSAQTPSQEHSTRDAFARLPVQIGVGLFNSLAIQTIMHWGHVLTIMQTADFWQSTLYQTALLTGLGTWDALLQNWNQNGSPYFSPSTILRILYAKVIAFSVVIAAVRLHLPAGELAAALLTTAGVAMLMKEHAVMAKLASRQLFESARWHRLSGFRWSPESGFVTLGIGKTNQCGTSLGAPAP